MSGIFSQVLCCLFDLDIVTISISVSIDGRILLGVSEFLSAAPSPKK